MNFIKNLFSKKKAEPKKRKIVSVKDWSTDFANSVELTSKVKEQEPVRRSNDSDSDSSSLISDSGGFGGGGGGGGGGGFGGGGGGGFGGD